MSRLFGNGSSAPIASRWVERRPVALLLVAAGAVVAGFLVASSTALAEGSGKPSHPQPQKLWNAYPLDPKGAQGQPQKTQKPRITSPSTPARESGGGSSSLLPLWISLAAFAASVLAFAVSWRESPRLRPTRRALILAGDNVRAVGRDLAAAMRRLRPPRTNQLALIAHRTSSGRTEPRQLAQVLTDVLHQHAATRPENVDVGLHSVPSPPEETEVSDADRERAVLKQKRAAATSAEVRKLKEKTRAPYDAGRRDEIGMLKAKLADSPESSAGAMLAARRVQKGER
jgi:hypothetical protein